MSQKQDFVLPTAAFYTFNSILFPQDVKTGRTDGKEHRVNRINQFVCQLGEEFYTPEAVLKQKVLHVLLKCPCSAPPMPKIISTRKNWLKGSQKHWEQGEALNRVTPAALQSRNSQWSRFLKFRGWHSPALTPVLPHCHSGTAHRDIPMSSCQILLCQQVYKHRNFKMKPSMWQVGSFA